MIDSFRRGTAVLCTAIVAAVGLPACGSDDDATLGSASNPQPFTLDLDWYVNPDHAGIYTALDRGYFEQAGLDVNPQVPSDPAAPIKQVAAGRVDLAVSYEPEVLLAMEEGLDVQAVAAIVDQPLTSLISLPAGGIATPADLRGKTVATAGIPYQTDYLETILADANLSPSDVNEVNVGLNLLPALLGGKAQAILGGFLNVEGVDLAQRGDNPRVVPVDQLGVPSYDELVLVAQRSRVEDDPDPIRLFISALANGTRDAIANPQAATESILRAGRGLDPRLTRAEIDATLPLLAPSPRQPFGQMNTEKWDLFASWMADHGLISEVPEADEVLTNELLPPPPE
jgi:putative hydroxymethylpyrimidine transport system substrate-binding protein